MSKPKPQKNPFEPQHRQFEMRGLDEVSPQKAKKTNWPAYYLDYLLKHPVAMLIVIGLLLEVQPYEPIQPSYFIATRLVNREEIVIEGVEDEKAHSEGETAKVKAKVECGKQRDVAANSAYVQCIQSGKGAGFCRFTYDQAKSLFC